MSNVAISFASIVKSNNGFFKSEAQAKFLISQCQEENTFFTGGNVYGNSFTLSYECDSKGVVKVEKYLSTTGKTETTFTRLTNEEFKAKQLAQSECNAMNAQREALAQAKFQARQDAFQEALDAAKEFTKQTLIKNGCPENMANQIVEMSMKDQDSITGNIDGLMKCPAFAKAWEAYNAQ